MLTANEHILTEFWLQIVEVAITSVGCQSSDSLLTMFIILPSSNECKAYLTLAPFTVVSAYILLTNPFTVLQDLTSSKTIQYSCDLSTSRSHATICRLD